MRKNTIPMEHPGILLKEEFLDDYGISISALAKAIGVTRARINEIVRGERAITTDTALRLSLFFGNSPEFWLNLQRHYDMAKATKEILPALKRSIKPLDTGSHAGA